MFKSESLPWLGSFKCLNQCHWDYQVTGPLCNRRTGRQFILWNFFTLNSLAHVRTKHKYIRSCRKTILRKSFYIWSRVRSLMLSLNLIVMHLWIVLRETHCLFKLTVPVVLRSTGVLCYWQQWASLSPECSGDVTCYDGARVGGPGAQHSQAWANTGHTHGVDTVANITTAVMKSDQVNHLWEPVWCHDMGPITWCQWVEVRVHSGHNISNNTGWHQRGAVAVASH